MQDNNQPNLTEPPAGMSQEAWNKILYAYQLDQMQYRNNSSYTPVQPTQIPVVPPKQMTFFKPAAPSTTIKATEKQASTKKASPRTSPISRSKMPPDSPRTSPISQSKKPTKSPRTSPASWSSILPESPRLSPISWSRLLPASPRTSPISWPDKKIVFPLKEDESLDKFFAKKRPRSDDSSRSSDDSTIRKKRRALRATRRDLAKFKSDDLSDRSLNSQSDIGRI